MKLNKKNIKAKFEATVYVLIIISIIFVGLRTFFPNQYGKVTSNQMFVVMTDSMDPVIKPKSIVMVDKNVSSYEVGDIITFRVDSVVKGKKSIVTHTLHSIEDGVYRTISEKSKIVDSWTLSAEDIIGKVSYSIPYLGYVILALQSNVFLILLSILVLCIILIILHIKYWSVL